MTLPLFRIGLLLYLRNRGVLFFFSSCIAAGTAFLFSVGNILDAVDHSIAGQARELLAADVKVSSNRPFNARTRRAFTQKSQRQTDVVSFTSMLRPEAGGPFLVSVKAIEPAYPLYGELRVDPVSYKDRFFGENACLIDKSIALQHGLKVGDSVRLGDAHLTVTGIVRREPDRGLTSFNLAPRLFLPLSAIPATGLVRTGSRIRYGALLAVAASPDPALSADGLKIDLERSLEDPYLEVASYAEAQPSVRRALQRVSIFFVLISLIALLLGTVGMSTGVTLFLNGQLETVGILRCLGLTPAHLARIYYALCLTIGLQGGLLGTAAGMLLSRWGLEFTKVFLGLELAVQSRFSPTAIVEGIAIACAVSLGVNAGKVRTLAGLPPLDILREKTRALPASPWGTGATILIGLAATFLYTYIKSNSTQVSLNFSLGMVGAGVALVVLISAGLKGLETFSRRLDAPSLFALRYGLLQLSRNKVRSLIFLFTLSAGFTLIGALSLVHSSLSGEILLGKADDVPDLFLIDIQKSQLPEVRILLDRFAQGPPLLSPLIRARLSHINGKPVLRENMAGLTVEERRRSRFLTREYNLTYKERLNDSESILAGAFWEPGERTAQISLEKGFTEMTGVGMGDRLRFDIQGRSVEAGVTSIRTIKWTSMNPNFFVVFPPAVIENAPQNFVGSLRVAGEAGEAGTAAFQRELVGRFPNISVIDMARILENIQAILGILIAALSVIAGFCVAVGLLVLGGTLALGHEERREHAALLRTLGAGTRTVIQVDAVEFLAIGSLTFLVSSVVAYGLGGYISNRMDITFVSRPGLVLATTAAALLLPLAVGLAVNLRAYRAPVLETLRREN